MSVLSLQQEFNERVERNKVNIPKHVMQVIQEEQKKLAAIKYVSESSIVYNYLDWLTILPWGIYSDEKSDVMSAEKILDEDHYGLSKVRERVLEHIAAIMALHKARKIICLAGPAGVGKTSIARSIARALHRNFFQLYVGGLSTASLIKGSPRTGVYATPGKMVQCLKIAGTSNPVVLIDDIDKLGIGNNGDTLNALLELLDPELNANFMDHYLNVTIDLSKVMDKTLAARRSQIKTIIFPVGNRKLFEDLPQNVKKGLDVHYVDEYEQIFELAFNYDH